jgi:hypothetical protein
MIDIHYIITALLLTLVISSGTQISRIQSLGPGLSYTAQYTIVLEAHTNVHVDVVCGGNMDVLKFMYI